MKQRFSVVILTLGLTLGMAATHALAADAFSPQQRAVQAVSNQDWKVVIEIATAALSDPQLPAFDRATFLLYRGRANGGLKNKDLAIADFRAAAELDGTRGYTSLAGFHLEEGDYSAADLAYQLALNAKGTKGQALMARASYAWFLAVCPDKSFRNPERALTLAEDGFVAAEDVQPQDIALLHIVNFGEAAAAANAAKGNFAEAAKRADALGKLAASAKVPIPLRPGHEERLATYKAGKPWYLPAKK